MSTPKHVTANDSGPVRLKLLVGGQVQGVGFRPFVYRLAHEMGLTGTVGNTSEGVRIEVQGDAETTKRFRERLQTEHPPLARILSLEGRKIKPRAGETAFVIEKSTGHKGHNVLVSPDVGICADCLADMHDRNNRRYLYPFTNCTNCGPRYTITRSIPYDRAVTSMACFPMCRPCKAEYKDLLDRRFHAQPIACPVCGPRLWYVDAGEQESRRPDATGVIHADREALAHEALEKTATALLNGKLVALRGLGGFQLACDAGNGEAVARLRTLKHRPHKSFALMARDLDVVRDICASNVEAEALLSSPARPAVILPKASRSERCAVDEGVAPDLFTLAVMLPTTPLHEALFMVLESLCRDMGRVVPVLVMTSGNDSGDPICLGNREALRRLAGCADAFLLHDRDILCRVDDSVVLSECPTLTRKRQTRTLFFRRARGYVPEPLPLPLKEGSCVLAMGSDLKSTCCLTRENMAFVGQHTGDLENVAAATFHREIVDHLSNLLEVSPSLVVTDLHPDFASTVMGRQKAEDLGVPVVSLQHHVAHAASVLAEHGRRNKTLAVVLDGFGLGSDGTLWGGEFLFMNLAKAEWRRVAHFSPFRLPGGDAATRQPWRIALALARDMGNEELVARIVQRHDREARAVLQMLDKNVHCAVTTSCGRLFDAVSAALGICDEITYEGQAAIRLETAALQGLQSRVPRVANVLGDHRTLAGIISFQLAETTGLTQDVAEAFADFDRMCVDSQALFARTLDIAREHGHGIAALDFHACLSLAVAKMAGTLVGWDHDDPGDNPEPWAVALAGGVFNNGLVRALVGIELSVQRLAVLLPERLPPGDGGLSLGQAAFGLSLLENGAFPEVRDARRRRR